MTLTGILIKMLLVLLFSICLAGIVTVIASTVLGGATIFGTKMVGAAEANMLFMVFLVTFLLAASSMTATFLKGTSLEQAEKAQKKASERAGVQKKRQVAQAKKDTERQKAEERKERQRELKERMRAEKDEKKEADKEARQRAKEAAREIKDAMAGSDDFEVEERPTEPEAPPPEEEKPKEADDGLSVAAREQKAVVSKFLGESLTKSGADIKTMDNFNKFGVNLFLAGACETLGQKTDLDEESSAKVLADSVRIMGFKKSHATMFAGKYEEYLMQDPRYMQMFQAGRNAMNTYMSDPEGAPRHLESAIGEWNQPKPKEANSGPITVLFTDIAGSTAMTQALGDAGAQEVVRAHNRVVRAALTSCNGKEVKHTGDGIMASFGKVTDSVDAAIQMQRETMIHNQQNPNLPLHLKIGINAGEPIAEDNDLFGTTVQVSARITDKAQADEIFVSEIVRGICVGKSYQFINRGGYAMKGLEEDIVLYELSWRVESAAAE